MSFDMQFIRPCLEIWTSDHSNLGTYRLGIDSKELKDNILPEHCFHRSWETSGSKGARWTSLVFSSSVVSSCGSVGGDVERARESRDPGLTDPPWLLCGSAPSAGNRLRESRAPLSNRSSARSYLTSRGTCSVSASCWQPPVAQYIIILFHLPVAQQLFCLS